VQLSGQGKTVHGVMRNRCVSDGKEQWVFHPDIEREDGDSESLLSHVSRLRSILSI
jgi:hypothetical protein